MSGKLFVVAYPTFDPPIAAAIAQFRQTYDREQGRMLAAHVTLVFGTTALSPVELTGRMRAFATSASPIEISFGTLATETEKSHELLSIAVLDDGTLARGHRELNRGIETGGHVFVPHITLARLSVAEMSLAEATAATLPLRARGLVSRLHLIELQAGRLTELAVAELTGSGY